MTDRELMRMALDALVSCSGVPHWPSLMPVIKTLRARLAQPEQEPPCKTGSQCVGNKCERCAVQEWQGLTDEEMMMIYGQSHEGKKYSLGRAIEAKLKGKNNAI